MCKNSSPVFLSFLLFLSISAISTILSGQELPTARLEPFTYSSHYATAQQADEVGRMVEEFFTNSGRFKMLTSDRSAVDRELDLQKDGIFLNGYMVEQGKALGARYIILGHLLTAEAGVDYATIQLGVVDVETGRNVAVEVLSPTGREASTLIMATDEADQSLERDHNYKNDNYLDNIKGIIKIATKKRLDKVISDFLDDYFPMTCVIMSMKESKEKITDIELYGYQLYDFRKGETFKVIEKIERENPDGTTAIQKIEIATLKVDEVQGAYAQCKVLKKGQADLYAKKDAEGLTVVKK